MNISIKHLTYLLMLVFMCCTVTHAFAGQPAAASSKTFIDGSSYTWYDGNKAKQVWLNPNLIAEFNSDSSNQSQAKSLAASATPVKTKHRGIKFWRLKAGVTGKSGMQQLMQAVPQGKISPVLHDGRSEVSRKRALPGNIIVHLDPNWGPHEVQTWLKQHSLKVEKQLNIGPNIFVIKTGPGLEALEKANALYLSGEVVAAYPDWWQEVSKR